MYLLLYFKEKENTSSAIGDYAYLQRYNIGRIEWFKVAAEGDTTD